MVRGGHIFTPALPTLMPLPRPSVTLCALVAAVLGTPGCQGELDGPRRPTTAREFAAAAARYHDPESRWSAFRADVVVASTLARGGTYSNEVLLDRARDTFRRRSEGGGHVLVQTIGPSGACVATLSDLDASAAELARAGVGVPDPCDVIAPRQSLYDFLIGLPMSALEGGTFDFGPSANAPPVDTTVFGEAAVQVRLTYPTAPAEPTWWLYVDPRSHRLHAARFRFPSRGGEWLHYPYDTLFDGFALKAKQAWYELDGTPVSVDAFTYRPVD